MSAALEPLFDRFRVAAMAAPMPIDVPVYAAAGRDPLAPVLLGSGTLRSPVGVFGRDPGRTEVQLAEPFIGKGGRLIRDGLSRAARGRDCTDDADATAAGRGIFWCNTVPYKPVGNKAWSVKVKRRFGDIVADLMVDHWTGADLITCGNVAFHWFGMMDRSVKPLLDAHWALEDRYRRSVSIPFRGKTFRLHPLPHPSPLNARWYKLFPALLDARLAALSWTG